MNYQFLTYAESKGYDITSMTEDKKEELKKSLLSGVYFMFPINTKIQIFSIFATKCGVESKCESHRTRKISSNTKSRVLQALNDDF